MQTSFLIKRVGVNLESDLKNRVRRLQFWGKFGALTPMVEMSINVQSKFTQNSETTLILQPA